MSSKMTSKMISKNEIKLLQKEKEIEDKIVKFGEDELKFQKQKTQLDELESQLT